MGRHGYSYDFDDDYLALGRWRGMVASAIRGRRGQAFLRELIAALEAMPDKRLISGEVGDYEYVLQDAYTGACCALGALGVSRGIDMSKVDPEDHERLSGLFDVAECLVQEVEWLNDEASYSKPGEDADEVRWRYMLNWAKGYLQEPAS